MRQEIENYLRATLAVQATQQAQESALDVARRIPPPPMEQLRPATIDDVKIGQVLWYPTISTNAAENEAMKLDPNHPQWGEYRIGCTLSAFWHLVGEIRDLVHDTDLKAYYCSVCNSRRGLHGAFVELINKSNT